MANPVAGDVSGIVVEGFIEISEGWGGVSAEEVLGSLDWNLLAVYEEELANLGMEVVDEIVSGCSCRIEDIGADAETLPGQESNGEPVAIVSPKILDPADLNGAAELCQASRSATVTAAKDGDAVAGSLGRNVAIDLANAGDETTDKEQALRAVGRFCAGLGIGGSDTGELVAVQAGDGEEASALGESGASLAR